MGYSAIDPIQWIQKSDFTLKSFIQGAPKESNGYCLLPINTFNTEPDNEVDRLVIVWIDQSDVYLRCRQYSEDVQTIFSNVPSKPLWVFFSVYVDRIALRSKSV